MKSLFPKESYNSNYRYPLHNSDLSKLLILISIGDSDLSSRSDYFGVKTNALPLLSVFLGLGGFDLGVRGGRDGGVALISLWVLGARSLRVITRGTAGKSSLSSVCLDRGLKL